MSDQPKVPDDEITLPKNTQEKIDKEKRDAILTEQIKRDLQTNPRYKKVFEKFSKSDVDHFINEYSWRKVHYLNFGATCLDSEERDFLQFETEGAGRLMDIQRKKLFDLESQWRAELITLPGIEQTWDFRYWENHVHRCPFLPPITEAEVDAYVDFVFSSNYEEDDLMSWDDLRYHVQEDEDGDLYYPEWYSFYDVRSGTGPLFKLPDIRGEKEEFYRGLCFDEERKDKPQPETSATPVLEQPRIGYHNLEFMESFIREFEDAKLLRYFHVVENFDDRHDDEELDDAIRLLKIGGRNIPIDADDCWRDAILKAADRFHREKLAEGIRTAYGDYLMRLENKVTVEEEDKDDFMDRLRKGVKEDIIKGRILNGEPPDLNF